MSVRCQFCQEVAKLMCIALLVLLQMYFVNPLANVANMIILQTARVFAPWRIEETSGDKVSWHEIARPQVHGHDINCVTFIQGAGNHRFVSGADEKVARVFEAPLSFLKTLHHAMSQNNFYDFHEQVQVLGANMSALGLSQKPIYMHSEFLCISLGAT